LSSELSYTLVVLETTSIQSYLFNSNRLKENVGASYLVKAATQDWVYDAIGLKTPIDKQIPIENRQDDKNAVELLYCGGGNAVLLFQDSDNAKKFIGALSRDVLRKARGLKLTFHSQPYDWQKQPLACAVYNAIKALKSARNHQPARMGIGGLGVTAMCASTSLPAMAMAQIDKDWKPISAEVFAKRQYADDANEKLRELFSLPSEYTFPLDFDDMGAPKGEKNTIGVVHADGNGLGKIIQGLKDKFPNTSKDNGNRAYITFMRAFSEGIKKLAQDAQRETIAFLLKSGFVEGKTLPFRPLVSGGDDVTFVC